MAVLLETSLGDIVVDLFTSVRPKCSLNFLKLCKIKYYNFSLFHNVQKNFIAQSGDPEGSGKGGSSIWGLLKGKDGTDRYFDCELVPKKKHTSIGTLSMVNNGNDEHGSQFFLTLGPDLDNLDGQHSVFGEVAEGLEVLVKISEAFTDKDGRPYQDIRILHTIILDDPFEDLEGMVVPSRSPSPEVEVATNRIGYDEAINDFEGKTEDEIQEILAEKTAKADAQILEIVGDIPDADGKPPENVLFVCKLNPATTSEDLEVIFSRFGTIISCEVIKDQKTGDSLQYAFIEFENEDDCVKAYFKMDNVLIDDRRIHVDFSQSLAKVKGIRKRPLMEDEAEASRTKNDGLAFKKNIEKQDNYDLVFDDNRKSSSTSNSKEQDTLNRQKQRDVKPSSKDRDTRRSGHHKQQRDRNRSRSKERFQERSKRKSKIKSHNESHGRRDRSRSQDRRESIRSHGRRDRSRSQDRRERSRSQDRRDRSRSQDRREGSRSQDRRESIRSHGRRDRSRSLDRDYTKSPRARFHQRHSKHRH